MDTGGQFVHQALSLAMASTKFPVKLGAVSTVIKSLRTDARQSGFGLWSQGFTANMGMHADLG